MTNKLFFLIALSLVILVGTLLPAANYHQIPIFTDEFIRTDTLTRIPLHIDTGKHAYPDAWPVSGGIPFAVNELKDTAHIQILDPKGNPVKFQTEPLAWWSDKKSIKWLNIKFSIQKNEIDPTYYLEYGIDVQPSNTTPIIITENTEGYSIQTDTLRVQLSKQRGSLLEQVSVINSNGEWDALSGPAYSYIELRDIEGTRSGQYSSINDHTPSLTIENSGPKSATFLMQSYHLNNHGQKTFPIDVRITIFKDHPRIKINHTFYVSENPATTFFPTIGIKIPIKPHAYSTVGIDNKTIELNNTPVSIWQDSAEVPIYPKCNQFAPFCKIIKDGKRGMPIFTGTKIDGWIRLQNGDNAVTVMLKRMWEEFPKGFTLDDNNILGIEFWPHIKPEPMDLRRIDQKFPDDYQKYKVGEGTRARGYEYNMHVYHRLMSKEREFSCSAFGIAKSHEVWLDFSSPDIPAARLAKATFRPLLPFVTPAWNRFSNALGSFYPEDYIDFPTIEKTWELQWDTLLKHQKEWFNWYGMYNWGDFQTNYRSDEDRWDYYNTKYSWRNGGMDIPYSAFLWYLRSGKRKYFDMAEIESLQLMDVCTKHPRTWSDERIMPKNWKGAGTSRYDKNHWGSGGGLDPEHCFSHSIQMDWLITGNKHARDIVMNMADNFYQREKSFNKKKYDGQLLHYHTRETDMPARLAANAYENNPLDSRWQEMLEYYIENETEGLQSMELDKNGLLKESCNGKPIVPFHYTLYKVPALNYLLTIKNCPKLKDACLHGFPLRWQDESEGGLSFGLLYQMTGNINYAKFAARQVMKSTWHNIVNSYKEANKGIRLQPWIMGGTWSTYPGLLEAIVKADLPLNPEDYDQRELNYYPLAQAGRPNNEPSDKYNFRTIDIRSICNVPASSGNGQPSMVIGHANEDISKGPIRFDFGPRTTLAPRSLAVTSSSYYPSTSKPTEGFNALPFGVSAYFNNIPFRLIPESTNNPNNILVIENGESYPIKTSDNIKRLWLLTGVSLANDPFHEGAGAKIEITYNDGSTETHSLTNMVHYQFGSFKKLYFDRKVFAGRLNTFNISVVGISVANKKLQSIRLCDTGNNARLCIFAITSEHRNPTTRKCVLIEKPNISSNNTIEYKTNLPNGLYQVAVSFEMSAPLGSPVDLMVQDKFVVYHAIPVAPTTYEVPVDITDGKLNIKIIPGEIHHKARSTEGIVKLNAIRAWKLSETNGISPIRRSKHPRKNLTYGWRLRGERCLVRDIVKGSAAGKKSNTPKNERLLNWDASYLDSWGIGRVEFLVELPNGTYDILLTMLASDNGTTRTFVEMEGKKLNITLPAFDSVGFRSARPVPYQVKQRITVKDGVFNLIVALPPKGQRSIFEKCGISSLIIKKTTETLIAP